MISTKSANNRGKLAGDKLNICNCIYIKQDNHTGEDLKGITVQDEYPQGFVAKCFFPHDVKPKSRNKIGSRYIIRFKTNGFREGAFGCRDNR